MTKNHQYKTGDLYFGYSTEDYLVLAFESVGPRTNINIIAFSENQIKRWAILDSDIKINK